MVRMSVAYLSAEVGFESGLHTYSGGLGVLAGDHIKSAADAGVDLVGCTLLYREGYGRQHLDGKATKKKHSVRLIRMIISVIQALKFPCHLMVRRFILRCGSTKLRDCPPTSSIHDILTIRRTIEV